MNRVEALRPDDVDLQAIRTITDATMIENYLQDESTAMVGTADVVYVPRTEAELAAVLRHCSMVGTPVTTSGAGTGLTCSRVPLGGVVLSTEGLVHPVAEPGPGERALTNGKHTVFVNDERMYAVAPVAIRLDELGALLAAEQLLYPPNPTEQTAFIGGTVACNASGGRTYHYGPTRAWVQAARVVLANGDVLDLRRGQVLADEQGRFEIALTGGRTLSVQLPSYHAPDVKDASGYYVGREQTDLLDLFIGSEGTLGVFTQVQLGLLPLPPAIFACTGYFDDVEAAVGFVKAARAAGDDSTDPIEALAIEFFDPHALTLLRTKFPAIPEEAGAGIFFEQAIEDGQDEDEILMAWADLLEQHGCIRDWSGFSDRDRGEMVDIRHAVPELCHQYVRQSKQHKVATDVAVPDDALDEIMNAYREIGEATGVRYVLFGHISSNHLHWDFIPMTEQETVASHEAFLELSRRAVELGGTISAEHGVGKKSYDEDGLTRPYLYLMYGEQGLKETALTKHQLDPGHILNRGNMVPESYLDELEGAE